MAFVQIAAKRTLASTQLHCSTKTTTTAQTSNLVNGRVVLVTRLTVLQKCNGVTVNLQLGENGNAYKTKL